MVDCLQRAFYSHIIVRSPEGRSTLNPTDFSLKIIFTTTVEPLHNGHLGDIRKWPLWRGDRYGEVGV